MIDDLTGRTRHRTASLSGGALRASSPVLVMQVEYRNTDMDSSPSLTLWRDARSEDLAELARLGHYPEHSAKEKT